MNTSDRRAERIAQLRAEYADVHEEAMRRIQAGCDDGALNDLQAREIEIDLALRALGTRLGA
jgi:hypothetical protein